MILVKKKVWKFSLFEHFSTDLKRFGISGDFIFFDEINGAKFFVGEIKDGVLTILKGYEWDGNTPKFRLFGKILGIPDFPETWEASLVHDFLIEYCRQHNISRKATDLIFEGILREKRFILKPLYSSAVHFFRPISRKLGGCN
jgi:hypothetical protein